eukprot:TRINITY_DN18392_c0_g1_i1.p1 TRINITY_DN18392_c0_g1~~TRINITY_DN18392_c0_g1_i1.p1  ORF type:complete len:242 (+),score=29.28 TRINITY_DN18392_c0_g1_i1:41-727(+)
MALTIAAAPISLSASRFLGTTQALESKLERKSAATARRCTVCAAADDKKVAPASRRDFILQSSSAAFLASVFHFGGDVPSNLGFQRDPPGLKLCPPSPNCISTSEEANDPSHFVPAWTYNPQDGRGRTKPASQGQAFQELKEVVTTLKPDGFQPTIIKETNDYLYLEYESSFFGFKDDVEFWFPPGDRSVVEYRSASRLGESDGDINRKRIRAIRKELEKKGWESLGF